VTASVVMSNLVYLIGAVVLAIIGGLLVVRYHRKPTSIESNVATFSKGLRALAPESDADGKATGARRFLPAPAVGPETTDRVKVFGRDTRRGAHMADAAGQDTEAEAG
jgi:hypothetical protein